MKNFYQLLEDLLEFKGYEIISADKGKIVGILEDKKLSVVIGEEPIHEEDLMRLDEAEGETVMALFEDIAEDIKETIPDDVTLWTRDILIREFGEMVLEKSVMEGFAEGEEGIEGPDDTLQFDIEHEGKEVILKPIMDFKHIQELGEKLVKGFKYRLELVPHYLFYYKVEKPDGRESQGKIYLNAISGKSNFWKKPFQSSEEIKRSHIKLEPKIPEDDCRKEAKKAVKDRFSTKKKEKREGEGVTIVEKSQSTPSEEKMDLEKKGIVYVPMWAVEGTEGIVVINAARGKVETEM